MKDEDVPGYVPSPDEAYEIGDAMGRHRTEEQAIRAHAAGEIDLWVEFVTPKTSEEWDEWESRHGDVGEFENRWKV